MFFSCSKSIFWVAPFPFHDSLCCLASKCFPIKSIFWVIPVLFLWFLVLFGFKVIYFIFVLFCFLFFVFCFLFFVFVLFLFFVFCFCFVFVVNSVVKFQGMVNKGFLSLFQSDSHNIIMIKSNGFFRMIHKYIGLAMGVFAKTHSLTNI